MVEDGGYSLGDDALACLKDLKKWLKLYDQKMNRFDVCSTLPNAEYQGRADLPTGRCRSPDVWPKQT